MEGTTAPVSTGTETPNAAQADPTTALDAIGGSESAMAKHQRGRSYEADTTPEDGGTEISDSKAEPEEKPQFKPRKLKVKDREISVESEEQYQALAQKGILFDQYSRDAVKERQAAQQERQQALAERQQFQQTLEMLKSNPLEALMRLYNGDEAKVLEVFQPYVESKILQNIEDERNPHQKAIREAQTRAERAEAILKQQEEQAQQAAQEQERAQWRGHYEKMILENLKAGKIPASKRAIQMYADQLYRCAQLKIEPNPEQIAENVRLSLNEDVQFTTGEGTKQILDAHAKNDHQGIMAGLEALTQVLGADVVKAIRIADLARLKESRKSFPEQQVQADTPKAPQTKKQGYMDMDEWREETRRRAASLQP